MPPMAKWEREPVSAVNVMMNTLVPTAVFNSYPSTLVRRSSIIIPPPAPIKPQIKPTTMPLTMDWISFCRTVLDACASLVVRTGLTMNLMPRSMVRKTEAFPMAWLGTREEI